MPIQLTSEAEKERIALRPKPTVTWGLYSGTSIVDVLHKAREMGWGEKKVQVRFEKTGTDTVEYIVEPYESGCGCSGLLKYRDYFGTETI